MSESTGNGGRSAWRMWLWRAGLLLGLVLFANQIRIAWLAAQQYPLSALSVPELLLAFVAALGLSLFQMLAWQSIMRYLRVALSLRATTEGFMISFLPRYIPGTVWGYLSRSQWLLQDYDTPYGLSLSGSVLEVIAILITAAACIGLTGFPLVPAPWGSLVLGGAVVLVAAGVLVVPRIVAWLGPRYARLAFPARPQAAAWVAALALTVPQWLSYGASVYFVTRSISHGATVDFRTSLLAASASWLVGFLIVFVPSGIGVRESVMSAILVQVAGTPPALAGLVAVVSRLILILGELTWIAIGFGLRLAGRRAKTAHPASRGPN
jgi:glycosyltransferase 2 family protein